MINNIHDMSSINSKITMLYLIFVTLIVMMSCRTTLVPDPHRFDEDIDTFSDLMVKEGEDMSVFTGSSSIRFWEALDSDCSDMKVVNTGFGGSQMSDLLYFLDQTVLRFNPSRVYIYEGDNDIAAEQDPEDILNTARHITKRIWGANSRTEIYFISAKPSPARWSYKQQYLKFNALLKDYCNSNGKLHYIDVWDIMLDDEGRPLPEIFIADSLHMNRKGYDIWNDVICNDF